jgi:hypothetical protein
VLTNDLFSSSFDVVRIRAFYYVCVQRSTDVKYMMWNTRIQQQQQTPTSTNVNDHDTTTVCSIIGIDEALSFPDRWKRRYRHRRQYRFGVFGGIPHYFHYHYHNMGVTIESTLHCVSDRCVQS